jgi:hypothetical protein
MTQKEFREICVLSGTDYNINVNANSFILPNTIALFRKYKALNKALNNVTFYDWIRETNLNLNLNLDIDLLKKINSMFDILDIKDSTTTLENIKIYNGPIQKELVRKIMKEDGFLFID